MSVKFGVRPRPTQQQIDRAKSLRAEGMSWSQIEKLIDASGYLLRCAVEPQFRQRRMETISRCRKYGPARPKKLRMQPLDAHPQGHNAIGDYGEHGIFIPHHVELERARASEYRHSDTTAAICGDPPPWRSALGKKNKWP